MNNKQLKILRFLAKVYKSEGCLDKFVNKREYSGWHPAVWQELEGISLHHLFKIQFCTIIAELNTKRDLMLDLNSSLRKYDWHNIRIIIFKFTSMKEYLQDYRVGWGAVLKDKFGP